jgi:hypothetical protein
MRALITAVLVSFLFSTTTFARPIEREELVAMKEQLEAKKQRLLGDINVVIGNIQAVEHMIQTIDDQVQVPKKADKAGE